jgi:RimJ/RimL family protein N-acetyltransferase
MIGTERVTLAPAEKHWRIYRRLWKTLLASPDAALLFGAERPRIPSRLDRAWRAMFGESGRWKCHRFVINMAAKNIGVADIHQDRPNAVCFLVLGLLPEYRGKKLGTVAARLMLRKSFEDLRARRVESSVISSNTASLRMQDGMIQEGVLKDRCVVGSQMYDEVLFRLLKSEWENQLFETERRSVVQAGSLRRVGNPPLESQ